MMAVVTLFQMMMRNIMSEGRLRPSQSSQAMKDIWKSREVASFVPDLRFKNETCFGYERNLCQHIHLRGPSLETEITDEELEFRAKILQHTLTFLLETLLFLLQVARLDNWRQGA